MTFLLTPSAPWGGRERWEGVTPGSGSVNDSIMDTGDHSTITWTSTGGLLTSGSARSHAKLSIDPITCKFSVEFHPYMRYDYASTGGSGSKLVDSVASAYVFDLTAPDKPGRDLSSSVDVPVFGTLAGGIDTSLVLLGPGAGSELEFALGHDNLGSTGVGWALRPAWYWGDP
jgi:hypothetical protein